MTVPILPPGATTDASSASVLGTVAPTTSGADWEIFDRYTSAIVATNLSSGSWGIAVDGSGGYNWTVPASAAQGHDPDGTGRYELRTSAAFNV